MTEYKMLRPGDFYKDKNDQLNQVITVAFNPKDEKQMVVYQGLYNPFRTYVEFEEDFFSHMFEMRQAEREIPTVEKSEQADEIDGQEVSAYTISFLDAVSYEEKLNVLIDIKGKINDKILDDISVSLDLNLDNKSVEEKYESIRNYLLTLKKYEGKRLR